MKGESLPSTDGFDRTRVLPEQEDIELGVLNLDEWPQYRSDRAIDEERNGQVIRLRTRCHHSTGEDLFREYPTHVAASLLLFRHYYHLEFLSDDTDLYSPIVDMLQSLLQADGIDWPTLRSTWTIHEVLPPTTDVTS